MSKKSALLGDLLPLEEPLTDRVLGLTDGGAFAMLELDGVSPETADVSVTAEGVRRLNTTLRNANSGDRLVLMPYLCRGLAPASSVAPVDPRLHPYAQRTGEEYRANLLDGLLYQNRIFWGLQLRPLAGGRWWNRGATKTERAIDRARRLEELGDWLASELGRYGPRQMRLTRRPGRGGVFVEHAEALAYALTGVEREVGLTTGRIGDSMLSEEVTFHAETVEIRGPGHSTYVAHLGLREYPAETWPGMLDALLTAPFRHTLSQHFEPLTLSGGLGLLTRKQNKMVWAGDKARSQIADLETAADELQSNKFVMGRHYLSLAVFADRAGPRLTFYQRFQNALRRAGLGSIAAEQVQEALEAVAGSPHKIPLSDAVNAAWMLLGGTTASVARESRGIMGAWLAQVPGNRHLRPRQGACSSRNFAALAAPHNYPQGMPRSRWGGPIMTLRTSGGTPFPLHWHDGEGESAVGATLVTGDTGSGKTAAVGAAIRNTVGRADAILLDHKQGWRALTLHLGGPYTVLGVGQPMFAPLKALDNTPENLEHLFHLLRGCITQGGFRNLTSDEDRLLADGIAQVMQNDPADRSIGEVAAFLSPDADEDGAGARLLKWCRGNELGWVLDAPECGLCLSHSVCGLDTTALLAHSRAAGPAFLYLFYRIRHRLTHNATGKPLLLVVDEGWAAAKDPAFREPIAAEFRTIRSRDGVPVFITQSPGDAKRAGMDVELIELCPNQMHFPNPRTSREDYVETLKRSDGEYDALRQLEKGSGRFLLCKGSQSLVVEIPMKDLSHHLPVVSASEESLRALAAVPPEIQAEPARLEPAYLAALVEQRGRREQRALEKLT